MQNTEAMPSMPLLQSKKSFTIAVILVILAVIGLSTYSAFNAARSQVYPQAATVVSQPVLAERYGLKVNLIAVTAASGMLDLRLRIIDGQKAKALLGDKNNFPALLVGDGVVLQAMENIASQTIKFDNGSNLFVLYPNGANVSPGDPVSVVFGDLRVEPILAK